MPSEVIQLQGSPADLLGNAAALWNTKDDEPTQDAQDAQEPSRFCASARRGGSPFAQGTDDDEVSIVSIHEPPRELSAEEKEERRQLIRKIGRYRALFPAELTDVATTGLDSMPIEALRDLSLDVEFMVGTRRSAKAMRGVFIGGLQAVETAGPLLGLELRGLANLAASSEDLLSTVDEVSVKHEQSLYIDPVARLALSVVQLALAVDSHNRRPPTQTTPVVPPAQGTQAPAEAVPPTPTRPDNIAAAQFSDL